MLIRHACCPYWSLFDRRCLVIGQDVWQEAREGHIDPPAIKEMLESLRKKADIPLSVRSLHFLSLDDEHLEDFVQLHKQQPIKRQVRTHAHAHGCTHVDGVFFLVLRPSSRAWAH